MMGGTQKSEQQAVVQQNVLNKDEQGFIYKLIYNLKLLLQRLEYT